MTFQNELGLVSNPTLFLLLAKVEKKVLLLLHQIFWSPPHNLSLKNQIKSRRLTHSYFYLWTFDTLQDKKYPHVAWKDRKQEKWAGNQARIRLSMMLRRNVQLKYVTSKLPLPRTRNALNVIKEDPLTWTWPLDLSFAQNVLECCKFFDQDLVWIWKQHFDRLKITEEIMFFKNLV